LIKILILAIKRINNSLRFAAVVVHWFAVFMSVQAARRVAMT